MTDDLPDWALELLGQARVARLGTADAAGQPLVVPVCYAVDLTGGRRVYTAIDAKPKRTRALRRLRNIAENPRISLAVDHYDEDWRNLRYVIVEGRAQILTEGPERQRALALLVAKYPQYRALELERRADPVIAIIPRHFSCWRAA